MTDRNDSSDGTSEGFLERWSRRKVEAERETSGVPAELRSADLSGNEPVLPERAVASDKTPIEAPSKPAFDLASLPSLDSITAATDIRAFLSPGVPSELARAALRRAWSADPAIRDFKGLAENDWDFTDPAAMAGFGDLPPGYDVKKLVAQIFGDGEKPVLPDAVSKKSAAPEVLHIAKPIASPALPTDISSPTGEAKVTLTSGTTPGEQQAAINQFVQRDNNTASHNNSSNDEADETETRRQHGGALPQ